LEIGKLEICASTSKELIPNLNQKNFDKEKNLELSTSEMFVLNFGRRSSSSNISGAPTSMPISPRNAALSKTNTTSGSIFHSSNNKEEKEEEKVTFNPLYRKFIPKGLSLSKIQKSNSRDVHKEKTSARDINSATNLVMSDSPINTLSLLQQKIDEPVRQLESKPLIEKEEKREKEKEKETFKVVKNPLLQALHQETKKRS